MTAEFDRTGPAKSSCVVGKAWRCLRCEPAGHRDGPIVQQPSSLRSGTGRVKAEAELGGDARLREDQRSAASPVTHP